MQKNRIQELDALRGIAALSVVFFHFTIGRPEAKYGFNLGWMGVELFFIISGFVIFMTLEKCAGWKDFVVSRFSRLYPAYWFAVTLTSLLILIFVFDNYTEFSGGDPQSYTFFLKKYLANMTMLHYYFKFKDIDGPYWTLTIELVFYAFMLLLFVTRMLKHVEKVGAAMLVLCFLYSMFLPQIDNNFILHKLRVAFPLITYFPLFFAGILIYKLKFDKTTYLRVGLLIACFLVQPFLFEYGYRNKGFVSLYEYIFMLSLFFLFFLTYLKNRLGFIVNRYSVFLGDISYSLYLIHQFIGCSLLLPTFIAHGLNFWVSAVFALFIIIVISFLMNRFIEKPAMRYIRSRYRKKPLQSSL